MDIQIDEVVSTVRAVDTQALLSPQIIRRLTEAVAEAVRQQIDHEKRTHAERRVTGGVSDERDQER